ncbi:hypothetical protein [Novipirellula caenicola]|uniref:Uncharacterized protein n=1 Tax=Novipirellula caenicola TaxID=1536901 RepID=A0ABP9VIA6_9BACT
MLMRNPNYPLEESKVQCELDVDLSRHAAAIRMLSAEPVFAKPSLGESGPEALGSNEYGVGKLGADESGAGESGAGESKLSLLYGQVLLMVLFAAAIALRWWFTW